MRGSHHLCPVCLMVAGCPLAGSHETSGRVQVASVWVTPCWVVWVLILGCLSWWQWHVVLTFTKAQGRLELLFLWSANSVLFCAGWIRQAQASVLHQHGHLPAVLQRGEPFILPEREWEVGCWNSLPLPQGTHYPGWDTVRPPGGCQSPHRAGQVQRKASLGGGCKALCWGNKSRVLHRVLRFDSEKPQGGLWCSHRGWHSVLGYPAATKEIQM